MTGAEIIALLWRFRFTLALLALIVTVALGVKLLQWKDARIAAETTRASLAEHRAEAAETVLRNRARREEEQERENARLREKITDILRRSPAAANWARTPIPAPLLGLLQAPADSAAAADTDAAADLERDE